MKEYLIISVFVIGLFVTVLTLTFIGMDIAFNRMKSNREITPIIVHCPDNTKQIVIPEASKLTL